ncbi:hypothetical protein L210DRAFT_3507275 [Boletus edulis BED1]|uniref:Uncharacterized protein n=1 Tax=Boletus edulis BED1 TaxID=1328754 RepID=A0AAD4BKP3_BOLED|nr:hypothetical protein L210DRAFT_3507275 [Boletus edulis BED1]
MAESEYILQCHVVPLVSLGTRVCRSSSCRKLVLSEKLEFRVRERPSAAPIPDPIEPVLTLRANMRGVDGLLPSVGDSECHAFNRIRLLPGPLNMSGSNPSSSCTASVEAGEPDGARLFKMWRYAPWMSLRLERALHSPDEADF